MTSRENFLKYLKGKNVCLVGPAPSIKQLGDQSDLIDSYDVVVRINKALPIPESIVHCSGTKTDVLYNCLNDDPESGGYLHIPYLENEIDWLVCPYPNKSPFFIDIKKFISMNNERVNFCHFDLEYYNKLELEMGTRPNSGVLAILDLLSADIKSLHITGITFFRGGYISEYRDYSEKQVLKRMRNHGNHKQEPQLKYIKNILKNSNITTYDRFLEEIINE